jgi:rhodanese-related sulfurtransferase
MIAKQVKGISAKELHEMLNGSQRDNVILVDVRTPGEQAVSRLPGNVLTKEEFEQRKDSLDNPRIVVYW